MDWLKEYLPKSEPKVEPKDEPKTEVQSNQPGQSEPVPVDQSNQDPSGQVTQSGPSGSQTPKSQVKSKVTKKATQAAKRKLKANLKNVIATGAGIAEATGTENANQNNVEDDDKEQLVQDDNLDDQMAVAETYADYKPAKLTFGAQHPDPVVETATLSSVAPTEITYQLKIPKKTIKKGLLSAVQLESIIYASQAHEQFLEDESRAGFLIGNFVVNFEFEILFGIFFNLSLCIWCAFCCCILSLQSIILYKNIELKY